MRIAKNLIFTCLAVLVIVLAACKNDGGDPPTNPPTGLNLPDLDVTESTGQTSILGTTITLKGEGAAAINIPQQILQNGAGNFSVTGGKLSFELKAPSSGTMAASSFFSGNKRFREFFGRADSGYAITFSPDTANILGIGSFDYTSGGTSYYMTRTVWDTDDNTYAISSDIVYFYVDTDCTFSRGAISWTGTDDDGLPYTASSGAFNLPLKAGWNLLQLDYNGIQDTTQWKETYTVKIADKDVPWIIEKE